jgi:hypothetical protein
MAMAIVQLQPKRYLLGAVCNGAAANGAVRRSNQTSLLSQSINLENYQSRSKNGQSNTQETGDSFNQRLSDDVGGYRPGSAAGGL